MRLSCNVCGSNGRLYLYNIDDFIYSLCRRCLSSQLEIMKMLKKRIKRVSEKRDKFKNQDWDSFLNKIANGEITRDDLRREE